MVCRLTAGTGSRFLSLFSSSAYSRECGLGVAQIGKSLEVTFVSIWRCTNKDWLD